MNTIFYISSAIAVLSTIMVITRTHSIHALLYLIVSLLSIAVIFFTVGAHFVAALEIIIYAGAIMVLFIFVIMMLNVGKESGAQEKAWFTAGLWTGPVILSVILLGLLVFALVKEPGLPLDAGNVSPKEAGIALFGKYLIGVEISAMLLMAGIIGAYHLGKQKKKVTHRFLEE